MGIDKFIKQFDCPVGPIEVRENEQISWNNIDWPIYLKCSFDEEAQKLIKIMRNGWKISKPQIIITLISDFNSLDNWLVNENIRAQFTTGLNKVASSAKMWILTNGVDVGASRLMSTIVNDLKCWEKAINQDNYTEYRSDSETICIGVIKEDRLTSDPIMQRHLKNIQNLSEPSSTKSGKFFIDDKHSHFIFLNGKKEELEQLFTLELMYQISFETIWNDKDDMIDEDSYLLKQRNFHSSFLNRIPFVSILIQGDQASSLIVTEYLIKQIPIVVFRGTGGFADLLYYAYNEIHQMMPDCDNHSDELNDFKFLNRQFSFIFKSKIVNLFPELKEKDREDDLNLICKNLIDCIRYSIQDGIEYLTFLNVDNDKQLSKLNEFLLNAYIKSTRVYELDNLLLRHSRINSEEELLNKNLKLTLDWNCPSIAKDQLTRKLLKGNVKIDRTLFKRALIEKNRESFVECFMEAGFQTRQLFNLSTIEWFFNQALKKEFFLITCCERILNLRITTIQSLPFERVLLKKLNQLIIKTTNFQSFFDETSFTYQNQSSNCIENKMITFIIVWSVLTMNIGIVRQLWSFHSEPIHMLLIACNMLKNLNKHITDLTEKEQLDQYKDELGSLATSLLDEAFSHARFRAIDILTSQRTHFNKYLACDLAANALVFSFIEHQHTQKWLKDLFLNGIYFKQFSKFGTIDHLIPNGFKILCCVLFVFPIDFWLHFSWLTEKEVNRQLNEKRLKKQKFFFLSNLMDDNLLKNLKNSNYRILNFNDTSSSTEKLTGDNLDSKKTSKLNFLTKLHLNFRSLFFYKWMYLMNAPVTKFWTSMVFFLLFLFLFTYAIIYPSCGSKILDTIIFIWYNFIVIEDIRVTYLIMKNYLSMEVYYKYFELTFTFSFLIVLFLGRIVDYNPISAHYQYSIKMFMCAVLLQNWFSFVFIYLPISPTLGPLFYYLKKMITSDTFYFLILVAPVLVGSGIAIQVSLYPDKPFNSNITEKIITRTFLNMFLTIDDDLKYSRDCYDKLSSNQTSYKNFFLDGQESSSCVHSFTKDPECPNIGFASFLFSFSFFILLKLILLNILSAMFSSSLVTYDKQTIWRFQRFNLIMFFTLSSPFPPPLTFIYYTYLMLIKVFNSKGEKIGLVNQHKYCSLCCNELSNHFWKRISSNVKGRISDTTNIDNQNDHSSASQQVKINELNKNLHEIKKVLFQLDYSNVELSDKEILLKLKWITKK